MKIAVTHENCNVFQHFGHTQEIKIYEVKDNKVINTEIISTTESGHSALAYLLEQNKINVLICGNIGGCAINALKEFGIELYAGITGNADEAVNNYLNGNIVQINEANCSHHQNENASESHSCCH